MSCTGAMRRVLDLPEVNIALFAFLLSFPWEMLQSPFFHGLTEAPHWEAVRLCTAATLGDVAIMLTLFWVVAGFGGGRQWVRRPRAGQVAGFTVLGLVVTIILEILATHVWHRWSYSALMPIIPLLKVGLVPLLMWGCCRRWSSGSHTGSSWAERQLEDCKHRNWRTSTTGQPRQG